MDDLDRLLNSVGKSVFVQHYALFADPRIPDSDIVERLAQEYDSVKACRTRTSKARRIFREGRQREALRRIAGSERVDETARRAAARLLEAS